MEISIKWNICRVCLQEESKNLKESESNQMRPLFNGDKKLAYHIYQLSGVLMKPGDHMPDKICRKCVSIVNNAVQLRKTCRSSNVYLKSVLERTKTASTFFKPESLTCQVSDDDEMEEEGKETETSAVAEREHENTKLEKQKDNEIKIEESREEHLQNIEDVANLEQQSNQVAQDLADNISENTVELEEIIECSEEIEDQIFAEAEVDDGQDDAENSEIDLKYIKPETSQLQKFYMTASFAKHKNAEDEDSDNSKNNNHDVEIELRSFQESDEELYHIFKDIKNENSNENDDGLEEHEDDHHSIQYIAIEEDEKVENDIEDSLMLHLEEKIHDNENQAQVSSTVDTNDEIEYYEHDSNISSLRSDIEEERLVGKNFNKCDISSSKSSTERIGEENSQAKEKIKTLVILPRRKTKRNSAKSAGYPSTQVCVCEICGNQFTNRNLMNIHMKVHYQEKNHQCELCFKRFITACNLQAHMRIHTGEKPFVCKYCDRRFNDRTSNLRHERTHTNEKPFECSSCGKSFSLATTLQNHMKVHTNERSYRCEPCGKSFKLPHHLKTHQNTSLHRSVLRIEENNEN